MLSRRAQSPVLAVLVWLVVIGLLVAGILVTRPYLRYHLRIGSEPGSTATTISPTLYAPPPSPTPTPVAPVAAIAEPSGGRLPTTAALGARIQAVPRTGIGQAGIVVIDPRTGNVVYEELADRPMTPASTLKTLTSAALLHAYGPDHRFTTKVVSAGPGAIVLVGGGDPYLRGAGAPTYPDRPSIVDLAERTATTLKQAGTTSVTLTYDDSLFTGPAWNPGWLPGDSQFATPTSALWLDRGIVGGVHRRTPSADTAATFAAQLTARGVAVTAVTAGRAPEGATPVAEVRSLPLDLIVQELLLHSDNDVTEVLFRHVAVAAGRPGSITEASAALADRLRQLGLWHPGFKLDDGSGLSHGNLVTPRMLAKVIALSLSDPRYRSISSGLPTAASDGTLSARFEDPATEAAGRGQVRAKTGTLTGVHTFNGFTTTSDGAVVAFAVLSNDVAPNADLAARDWLERVTSAIAGCGCS